jgi:hypothetical protein
MNQETSRSQAATPQTAERFCELVAELIDNPVTGSFGRLSDELDELAKGLIEDNGRQYYADALRFNKSRFVAVLVDEGTQPDAANPSISANEPPSSEAPGWLQLPDHARHSGKAAVDVLTGDFSAAERIGALSELLDDISSAVGNGYLPGLLWYVRLRVLMNVSRLDPEAQRYLTTELLSEGALAAGLMDHWFPRVEDEPTPTPDMEAIAEGGGMEACALLDWLLTYLLRDPDKGHDKEDDIITQKTSAVLSALNADDESPEFLFLLGRLRKLFAAMVGQIQQPQDGEESKGISLMSVWFEKYKREWGSNYKTGEYLQHVLSARDEAADAQAFERDMVGISVAHLLESDETPGDLRRALADYPLDVLDKARLHDPLDPNEVREVFSVALDRLAGDDGADEKAALTANQQESN